MKASKLPIYFFLNKAKWHKSCHPKFAPSKLLKARERRGKKRQHPNNDEQRRSKRQAVANESSCIFCSQSTGKLHRCSTMKLDHELRKIAIDMQDTSMLAREDLIAIDEKYHLNCLMAYKNKYRSHT